jgi:hypothetical protein
MTSSSQSTVLVPYEPQRKRNLLILPFEIRRKIDEFACEDTTFYVLIAHRTGNPSRLTYCSVTDHAAILLVCSQKYTEARTVFAKHTSLHIDYDRTDQDGQPGPGDSTEMDVAITEALLSSCNTPMFLRYARRFAANYLACTFSA